MGIFSKNTEEDIINKKVKVEQEIFDMFKKEYIEKHEKQHPSEYYCAFKKFSYLFGYTIDTGFFGIADRSLPGFYFHGDILFHTKNDDICPGDILLYRRYASEGFYLLHGKVKAFDTNGNIKITFSSGEEGYINSNMIIGVLIDVIPFKEGNWDKYFNSLNKKYDVLKTNIRADIEFFKTLNEVSEDYKNKIISELERRIGMLEEPEVKNK